MTTFTPALDTALRADVAMPFGCIGIALPGQTLNLLDGAGTITVGGQTFVGLDDTFGTLSDIEDLSDGAGDSAPALKITLLPPGDAAAASLASPLMQGSQAVISLGALNPATGQVIGVSTVFVGEIDVPTLNSSDTGRTLDYDIVSVFERLFEDDESARLSPGFHRSIFSTEAGLDMVTGVDQTVYWGVAASPQGVTYASGSGGSSSKSYVSKQASA